MRLVKTKRANVVTYTRPSVKAIKATLYEKRGQELIVKPCIKGWFEVRKADKDGVRHFEFVRGKDVKYNVKHLVTSLVKYVVTTIKKSTR